MKLLTIGNFGLHTIQYPSKRWGFVGSIPDVLCVEKINPTFKNKYMDSPVFETEDEAVQYFNDRKHLLTN